MGNNSYWNCFSCYYNYCNNRWRDDDNDNLFVSKLVSNNDGTSNMVNIEDSAEKSKINEVVKELVTYSIKSEEGGING